MKKLIAIALAAGLALICFTSCYTGGPVNKLPSVTVEGDLNTGLAIDGTVSGVSAADGENGKAKGTFNMAAVLVDESGVIVDCKLDVLQTELPFTADGQLAFDGTLELPTKNELGDNYMMRDASPIGKEWYEQAEYLSKYVLGKTADEVAAMPVGEDGKSTDADLLAGCTVTVSGYLSVIAEAARNATSRGAAAGDTLGLGVVCDTQSKSKPAADGANGKAQVDVTVMALTRNADGTITSAVTDTVQAPVEFTAAGEASEEKVALVTKYNLGDDYQMRDYSGIGKEWFEQADALCAFMRGKTIDQLSGAVTDSYPSDADLKAGCTIHMDDFLGAAAKADANAQA